MKIIPLKFDYAFKEVMAHEEARQYLISDILNLPAGEIRETRLGNPFLRKRFKWQKQGILDVFVQLKDGTKINIELQVRPVTEWKKRNLFYLAGLYMDTLFIGDNYRKLNRTVCISILGFNLLEGEKYHSVFRLRDEKGCDFTDLWELHILELNKPLAGNNRVDDWIRLFNAETEEELDMIRTENAGIMQAKEVLRNIRLSLRAEYRAYWKHKMDQKAMDEYAWESGVAKGMAEGMAKGIAEGMAEGMEAGREKGEKMLAALVAKLTADGRMEEMQKALTDSDLRARLYEEYGITAK